jgi:hypothetical protein
MWVTLTFALAFFAVGVPLLVFVCVRDEAWGEEAAPIVRWLYSRRIKAFATATAAGDFLGAESFAQRVFPQPSPGTEPGP